MFNPNYKLTPKLLNLILKIERIYGQLSALRVPKSLELNLKRTNLIQSTYISNSIEGNPLTLPEVTNLLLDGRVPANRNEKEVTNYFEMLGKLPEHIETPFSLGLMNLVHQEILKGVNDQIAGKTRDEAVAVGKYMKEENVSTFRIKHQPPYHSRIEIEKYLNELYQWLKTEKDISTILKAGIFHHHFVYIHPFIDGNGRVCRILTTLVFLKGGYNINKYFVLDDYYDIDRHLYSDKLHTADSGDKTEWLEYFCEGVMHSLKSAFFKIKNEAEKLNILQRLTTKENEVLNMVKELKEVNSAYLVKKLKVSRQQAHNLLRSLVEKGFLGKKGSTKSSYYFWK